MILVFARVALAQDVSFDAVTRVEAGRGWPTVTLRSLVEGTVRLALTCGSSRFSREEKVHPGSSFTVALSGLPLGESACSGQARLDRSNGDWAEMPLSFGVAVLSPLELDPASISLDLAKRTLAVSANRPLAKAEVQLVGEGGTVLGTQTAVLADKSRPSFSWSAEGEILKLVVTGADPAGFLTRLELSPWSYAIPHDDVVFAPGSAEITDGEVGKLERCYADVQRVVARYGSVVDIELFVAGYTDTVGSSASNQALSERRAAAIAGWFAERGFSGPIWYQGFGETVLKRPTPDETDEVVNRRALYLLAAEVPPPSAELPRQDWRRVR